MYVAIKSHGNSGRPIPQHGIHGIREVQAGIHQGSVKVEDEQPNLFYWNSPINFDHYSFILKPFVAPLPIGHHRSGDSCHRRMFENPAPPFTISCLLFADPQPHLNIEDKNGDHQNRAQACEDSATGQIV